MYSSVLNVYCLLYSRVYIQVPWRPITGLGGGDGFLSPHLLNMRVQPVPLELVVGQAARPANPPLTNAVAGTTKTLERLGHVPLGTGIEEGQDVAFAQRAVVHNPHLHAVHVEVQRRRARVVDEDEVGVELDVGVAAGLHRRVGLGGGRGGGDLGEDGAGGEVRLRDGRAGEGFRAAVHV